MFLTRNSVENNTEKGLIENATICRHPLKISVICGIVFLKIRDCKVTVKCLFGMSVLIDYR